MAKIKDEDIDVLRERADIVEIVSAYTRLKKAGASTYKGLCPFHSEKTPSFTVDSSKGLFVCFGCGEGGNLYQFVQKAENLSFPDAVEWVARKTGFQLRYEEARPGEHAQARGLKERLKAGNKAAAEFFHDTLMRSPDALEARRYLGGRGFNRDVAKRWMLGYAPGRDALCKHLLARGFSIDELLQADLVRKSERDGSLYDTFRRRITFPTWDRNDDVVGFGARALGDDQPKYLNTSETPVFQKSRVMYGLNRAKSAIARGVALVVEGYTDVIALHEAGITDAVATNGVALGEGHLQELKRWTGRAVLMLDSDSAGMGATERAFDIHHRVGLEVLVALLPEGRDPAEVVAADGPDYMRELIDKAQPLLQFKLAETIAKLRLDTPEAKARAVRETARVLAWQPDPIARAEYVFMAAQRIGVDESAIQLALDEERGVLASAGRPGKTYEDRRLPGQVKVEREALRLLLTMREQAAGWLDQLAEGDFTSGARRELFRAIRDQRSDLDAQFAERLSPEGRSLFSELSMQDGDGDDGSRPEEVFARLRFFRLKRDIRRVRDTLQDVNPLDDAERHDRLFTELVALEAAHRDLLRRLERAS